MKTFSEPANAECAAVILLLPSDQSGFEGKVMSQAYWVTVEAFLKIICHKVSQENRLRNVGSLGSLI